MGLFDAPDYSGILKQEEQDRLAAIDKGTAAINTAFAQFTPEFYNKRSQAYINYAMPQVQKQYGQQRNLMDFNLANRGLLGSGVEQTQGSQLARNLSTAQQEVVDQGTLQSQQLEQQIQGQENTLLGNLYASADPGQATTQSVASAAQFAAPSVFAPIANLFTDLTNQYTLSQLAATYKAPTYVTAPQNLTYSAGVVGPSSYGGGGGP